MTTLDYLLNLKLISEDCRLTMIQARGLPVARKSFAFLKGTKWSQDLEIPIKQSYSFFEHQFRRYYKAITVKTNCPSTRLQWLAALKIKSLAGGFFLLLGGFAVGMVSFCLEKLEAQRMVNNEAVPITSSAIPDTIAISESKSISLEAILDHLISLEPQLDQDTREKNRKIIEVIQMAEHNLNRNFMMGDVQTSAVKIF